MATPGAMSAAGPARRRLCVRVGAGASSGPATRQVPRPAPSLLGPGARLPGDFGNPKKPGSPRRRLQARRIRISCVLEPIYCFGTAGCPWKHDLGSVEPRPARGASLGRPDGSCLGGLGLRRGAAPRVSRPTPKPGCAETTCCPDHHWPLPALGGAEANRKPRGWEGAPVGRLVTLPPPSSRSWDVGVQSGAPLAGVGAATCCALAAEGSGSGGGFPSAGWAICALPPSC